MTLAERTRITVDDLLQLGAADRRVEVIDGEIVEMPPVGWLHVFVAGNVYRALYDHTVRERLGYVAGDGLIYVLAEDAATGLRETAVPDASFVRKGRLPEDFDRARPFPGAPDLAVEVLSPSERAEDVLAKVRRYLAAGTEQVWVLYPQQQELHQHVKGSEDVRVYQGAARLTAETLLPGLSLVAADLFVVPDFEE